MYIIFLFSGEFWFLSWNVDYWRHRWHLFVLMLCTTSTLPRYIKTGITILILISVFLICGFGAGVYLPEPGCHWSCRTLTMTRSKGFSVGLPQVTASRLPQGAEPVGMLPKMALCRNHFSAESICTHISDLLGFVCKYLHPYHICKWRKIQLELEFKSFSNSSLWLKSY